MVTLLSAPAIAAGSGYKRTILTSGEKVFTIYYQLGQSTVLYFGERPETVICGNRNYFSIEKIKEGLTIQPLSNFSTNLMVLSQGHHYLFYLKPADGRQADSFVEVKWVPEDEIHGLKSLEQGSLNDELNKVVKSNELELTILRVKSFESRERFVFELELRSSSKKLVDVESLKLFLKGYPISKQTLVWEKEQISALDVLHGRLIVSESRIDANDYQIVFQGRKIKILKKLGRR